MKLAAYWSKTKATLLQAIDVKKKTIYHKADILSPEGNGGQIKTKTCDFSQISIKFAQFLTGGDVEWQLRNFSYNTSIFWKKCFWYWKLVISTGDFYKSLIKSSNKVRKIHKKTIYSWWLHQILPYQKKCLLVTSFAWATRNCGCGFCLQQTSNPPSKALLVDSGNCLVTRINVKPSCRKIMIIRCRGWLMWIDSNENWSRKNMFPSKIWEKPW